MSQSALNAAMASRRERVLEWSAFGFLALAVVLGGASREAPVPNLILQTISAALLLALIATWHPGRHRWSMAAIGLAGLAAAMLVFSALQLVPLPQGLWSVLPGRAPVAAGFDAMGYDRPALPLSLAPQDTLAALGGLLPPIALLALGLRLSWKALTRHLRWGIVSLTCFACLLGLLQAFMGSESSLYFYQDTNFGWPVGFFANVNHQATLMLMTIPFLAATASQVRFGWAVGDRDMGLAAMVGAAALIIGAGLLAAGSEFGFWMAGPVAAVSLLVYRGRQISLRHVVIAAALCGVVTAVLVALWHSEMLTRLGLPEPQSLFEADGRLQIFATTGKAIAAYWPVGSGLGSFEAAYPSYEDPNAVTNTFVNMAHNDYLQTLMELGALGAVLLLLAVAWWGVVTVSVWARSDLEDVRLRRAASVALGVVLVHSLVDYPARTAAIACFAVLCAVIMAAPSRPPAVGGRHHRHRHRHRHDTARAPAHDHLDL